jgi:hypothetical protein
MPEYFGFTFDIQKDKDESIQNHNSVSFAAVKLGLSYWRKRIGWGFSRMGCWGKYLGLRGRKKLGTGKNCILESLIVFTHYRTLFGWSNQGQLDGRAMWYMLGRKDTYTSYWRVNPKERIYLKNFDVEGRIIQY